MAQNTGEDRNVIYLLLGLASLGLPLLPMLLTWVNFFSA